MKAEYVACSLANQKETWLSNFLHDLNLTPIIDDTIEMLCDDTTGIQFAKDLKFHRTIKNIKKCYHFVQDTIKTKEIFIKYISINEMTVYLLPKSIPLDTFKVSLFLNIYDYMLGILKSHRLVVVVVT